MTDHKPTTTDDDLRAVLADVATDKASPPYARLQAARTLLKGKRPPEAPAEPDAPEPAHPAALWLAAHRQKRPDRIPCIGEHRGVELHDHQDNARLAVVRADIDRVMAIEGVAKLVAALEDETLAPEARLLAWAAIEVIWTDAAGARERRPAGIDLDYVQAVVAGLDSQHWRDPWAYGSLLHPRRGLLQAGQVKRPVPLREPA